MLISIDKLLKEKFESQEWYNNFFIDDNSLDNVLLKDFFATIINSSLIYFTESILTGEYVKDVDIENKIESITSDITKIYNDFILSGKENQNFITSLEGFVNIFKLITSGYLNFARTISIYNKNHYVDMLFSSNVDNEDIESIDLWDDVSNNLKNFNNTIWISKLDHFFDESYDYLKALIDFEHSIKDNKDSFIHIGALKNKLFFLKYKWSIRQTTTSKLLGHDITVKAYLVNNILVTVLDVPELNSQNQQLLKWKQYLESHYDFAESSSFIFSKYEEIKFKSLNDLNYLELHFLIKYYKDVNKDYNNLLNVVLEFERRENDTDKLLYYKNLNYAYNNQFSLLVENPNASENEVDGLRTKISSLQNKTGNNNFFLEFKYLTFCVNNLERFAKNREPLESGTNLKNKIEEVRSLFTLCEKKISWSVNHHNLLYQLPYNESLIDYNSENIDKIYYASTFLLPLSVEQIRSEFEELKIKFNNNYNHYEVLSSLNKELDVIKELKTQVEKNDKKSIETITIYTAVIAFIVGSVSVFNFIDSFYKAVIFTLIFSTSLSTFSLLVFISTKGFKTILDNKKPIIYFYSIVVLLIFITFGFKYNSDVKNEKTKNEEFNKLIDKKIDSINKIIKKDIEKSEEDLKIKYLIDLKLKKNPAVQGQVQLKNQ